MIKTFTITGPDDSIKAEQLVPLSQEFPFVEWGILLSRKQIGNNRFPSRKWLEDLVQIKKANPFLRLSAHLCGAYVREFLLGDHLFFEKELKDVWPIFSRVQINTHGEPHELNTQKVKRFIVNNPSVEFILQYDNQHAASNLNKLIEAGLRQRLATLFDLSHGAGVLPEEWPQPLRTVHCGYAGGLSSQNLVEQIKKIDSITEKVNIWIDMETHVRSNMDQLFDLAKVRYCLELAQPSITFAR